MSESSVVKLQKLGTGHDLGNGGRRESQGRRLGLVLGVVAATFMVYGLLQVSPASIIYRLTYGVFFLRLSSWGFLMGFFTGFPFGVLPFRGFSFRGMVPANFNLELA